MCKPCTHVRLFGCNTSFVLPFRKETAVTTNQIYSYFKRVELPKVPARDAQHFIIFLTEERRTATHSTRERRMVNTTEGNVKEANKIKP